MPSIQFDPGSSEGKRAVVVSFDLCGFSDFCNHPEAYAVLPRFISSVFEELDSVFIGALEHFWDGVDPSKEQVPAPDFIKYTGDGALMIWFPPDDVERRQIYCSAIVAAMRRFRRRLSEIIPKLEIEWQINRLPQPVRVGIASGLVYPLKAKSLLPDLAADIDYAGYCINLAVRLQDHCPEVGFLVHELVFPKLDGLVKYIAHGMKGQRSEPVLIFLSDFPPMTIEQIRTKFQPCGQESELRCQMTQRSFRMENGIAQPRFEVHLVGGPWNGVLGHLPECNEWFYPAHEIKDSGGKTIEWARLEYKRVSVGPPAVYNFIRSVKIDNPTFNNL